MQKVQNLGRSLNKAEQKRILGGTMPTGSCQAYLLPSSGPTVVTNLSYSEASSSVSRPGEHWCCDSCCTASWSDKTGCPS